MKTALNVGCSLWSVVVLSLTSQPGLWSRRSYSSAVCGRCLCSALPLAWTLLADIQSPGSLSFLGNHLLPSSDRCPGTWPQDQGLVEPEATEAAKIQCFFSSSFPFGSIFAFSAVCKLSLAYKGLSQGHKFKARHAVSHQRCQVMVFGARRPLRVWGV